MNNELLLLLLLLSVSILNYNNSKYLIVTDVKATNDIKQRTVVDYPYSRC